jgi:hypothetical protein
MESRRSTTHTAHFSLDKKPHKIFPKLAMQSKHNDKDNDEKRKQHKTEKTRDADYGGRSSWRGVP